MGFLGSSTLQAGGVTTQRIYNETIAVANTEQSLVLPATVAGYIIRSRGAAADIKMSHTATESSTKYVTIPKKSTYVDEHIYSGVTLYFQSPTVGAIVEIVAWEI